MENTKVSIVIVCMNNLANLYLCLNSIRKCTSVAIETYVVAFMFSPENLKKLKDDYPWVSIVESNAFRGFSENNNLALRKTVGQYCFVVNDDTYFDQPVIDELAKTMDCLPDDVAIVSPVTLNKDGSVQRNGKPKYGIFTHLLAFLKLLKFYDSHSKYNNKCGIYQSYNITGACFLIRRDVFKNVGWFDERYYFCPEDIALSTKLNKMGYKCFVNADVKITHTGGGTWSKIQSATMPASEKGSYIFFCENNIFKKAIFLCISWFFHFSYGLIWKIKDVLRHSMRSETMYRAHFNTFFSVGSSQTPKQIFIKYYNRINK